MTHSSDFSSDIVEHQTLHQSEPAPETASEPALEPASEPAYQSARVLDSPSCTASRRCRARLHRIVAEWTVLDEQEMAQGADPHVASSAGRRVTDVPRDHIVEKIMNKPIVNKDIKVA